MYMIHEKCVISKRKGTCNIGHRRSSKGVGL